VLNEHVYFIHTESTAFSQTLPDTACQWRAGCCHYYYYRVLTPPGRSFFS